MQKEYLIIVFALINFILGFTVYWKNKKNRVNRSFFLFTIAVFIWSFALFFYTNPIWFSTLEWIKITYFLGLFTAPALFYFCSTFCGKSSIYILKIILVYFILSLPLIWVLFNSKLFVKEVTLYPWGYNTVTGIAYPFYGVLTGILVFLVFAMLFKKSFNSKGIEKLQTRYILIGVILFSTSAFIVDIIIPLITGNSQYFWISPIFSFFFVFFTFLAILRYHLFDIKVILAEMLVGAMGVILLLFTLIGPNLPSHILRISSLVVFLLFCIFGYYLIKATHEEEKRREEAEKLASQEKVLRKKAEDLAEGLKQLDEAIY